MKKYSIALLVIILTAPLFALNPLKPIQSIPVQFDIIRVVAPVVVSNTLSPRSERAFLPTCPAGTHYVSGVSPNLLPLDYAPNYPYCNCFCHGNCNQLPGVTSKGGSLPIYTATVTCAATLKGSFDPKTLMKYQAAVPHQYAYCQSGNCTSRPLPSELNFSVSSGGFQNTTQVNFQSCATAFNALCGAPDPTSVGRVAAVVP